MKHGDRSSAVPPRQPLRAADEPSFVLYTSGTTSRPMGAIQRAGEHVDQRNGERHRCGRLGPRRSDLPRQPPVLESVTGVVQALFIGPMLSAPVVLEDRWDPAATCDRRSPPERRGTGGLTDCSIG